MASARPPRKPSRRRRLLGLGVAAVLIAIGAPVVAVHGSTTERIVVDLHTGLALYGFDPVAYFTDGRAQLGRAELEYRFGGAIWRFRNVGNRAAFAERPDIYMPRYGGYDPIAIARGVAIPGRPNLWALAAERLYLFKDAASRDAFVADPPKAVAAAETRWPDVMRALAP